MNSKLSLTFSWRDGPRSAVRRVVLSLLGFLTFVLGGQAQSSSEPTGAVQGTVSNAVSGSPLGRAKVTIRGTAQETLTDDDGRFFLRGVPARDIELDVSYLGFGSQTSRVTVPPGGQVVRDFQLSRAGTDRRGAEDQPILLAEFQVVAEQTMSGQAVAMNEQRHAANIKNVVSFDELGDRGQENIGDYVRFLPGVSILDDGENPGRIALGGFPAEMSNIQIDGVDVAATGFGATSSRAAVRIGTSLPAPTRSLELILPNRPTPKTNARLYIRWNTIPTSTPEAAARTTSVNIGMPVCSASAAVQRPGAAP